MNNFTLTYPSLPTWRRLRSLHEKYPHTSILRKLMYEKLQSISLQGRCLDVGGGRNAKYANLLPDNIELESLNIDEDMDPTYLISPGDTFPVEDNSFDCVISLNTLEHIYDPVSVINDMYRVLKPGGVAHIAVPFLFKIHAHPDDFFRGTTSWWGKTMTRAGWSKTEIQALTLGKYTSGYIICRGKFHNVNLYLAYAKDILNAHRKFGKIGTFSGKRALSICSVAPGWFISSIK